MGFFDRLFGTTTKEDPQPDIRFGRYSDSYKEPGNYDAWDLAIEKFEEEDYLSSYDHFFRYLRDEREDNVKWWEDGEGIRFECYQGSKKIAGFADAKKLKAESKIARTRETNLSFLRSLIEKNYSLQYSRFALDEDQNITIVFDTYTLDGSPYKLYYALKELATNADKQDDLLLDEFNILEPVDTSHLQEITPEEKKVKTNFIHQQIQDVLQEVESGNLDRDQYPGGIAYLLLNLIYKLDYLIKPEGFMMETLERIHRLYFATDDKTTSQKNQQLCKELRKLLERSKEDLAKEMYRVTHTFGITTPVNHDRIISFIDGELNNMDWYYENGHERIALSVPGYIVGYCLFNYAAPKPDRAYFQLYYQIVEADYFKALGFTTGYYDSATGSFDKKAIRRAIDRIAGMNADRYQRLNPAVGILRFDSLANFAKSYLTMVRNLDMTKSD